MNTIITTDTGGFPFMLDDIRFLDIANREAFSDAMRSMYGGIPGTDIGVILYGADPGAGTATEGAIFYNNEIWHMDAHSFSYTSNANVRACFTVAYAASGSRIFHNGNPHQVHQIRKVVYANYDDIPESSIKELSFNQLRSINSNLIYINPINYSGTWIMRPGHNALITKVGRLVIGNIGFADDDLDTIGNFWDEVGSIPVNYRPLSRITGTSFVENNQDVLYADPYICWEIATTGVISIYKTSFIGNGTGIRFNINFTYLI
jgi:hypothetical protein